MSIARAALEDVKVLLQEAEAEADDETTACLIRDARRNLLEALRRDAAEGQRLRDERAARAAEARPA